MANIFILVYLYFKYLKVEKRCNDTFNQRKDSQVSSAKIQKMCFATYVNSTYGMLVKWYLISSI